MRKALRVMTLRSCNVFGLRPRSLFGLSPVWSSSRREALASIAPVALPIRESAAGFPQDRSFTGCSLFLSRGTLKFARRACICGKIAPYALCERNEHD